MLACAVCAWGQQARVVEKEGRVMVTKAGSTPAPATPGTGLAARDRLGTGEASRAVLQMSPRWFARVDEETDIEITPGALGGGGRDAVSVALGGAFVFSREPEGELKIITPSATGGLRGTQLVVRVFPGGRTVMQVLEGEVDLANPQGSVALRAGEAGEAEIGQAPRKTAAIEARQLLQWVLYYPAVLGPDEFNLDAAERRVLADSLAAYRRGDLLGALASLPPGFAAASDGARVYQAAVLLATGRVESSRRTLQAIAGQPPGRAALERMVAAVLHLDGPAAIEPRTAGEAVAESYFQQSRLQLEAARTAARRATALDPASGFAWVRLAELEFSFGRTREARGAVERGLTLTPRHAQARALEGFLLSADNRLAEARAAFAAAVELDGGLGNAWLGLGLVKIRAGRLDEGRLDLQAAATVEPTRSFLYSYHAKALDQAGDPALAAKDLALARRLDPADPTPALYRAVLEQRLNRYNEAIGSFSESIRLNDNRQVYRSRFLLDQDRASRRTNLATIFRNNGMAEAAVREATAAVDDDPTNASAHQFLADSYDALRDPRRLLLRYETAWFNELLLSNLLAPVGGGPLAQFVSQQEYSRLLESDGPGGSLLGEAREGGYVDVQAAAYATRGRFSTSFNYLRHDDPGSRANNDTRHEEFYWQGKFQPAESDSFYALVKGDVQKSGDLSLSTDNRVGSTSLRSTDKQEPGLALIGWNHRWSPGHHTLVLAGRLAGRQALRDDHTPLPVIQRESDSLVPAFYRELGGGRFEYASPVLRNATVPPVSVAANGALVLSPDFQRLITPYLGLGTALGYSIESFGLRRTLGFRLYSAEVQHLWHTSRHSLVLGTRWQAGDISATALLTRPTPDPLYTWPAADQAITGRFHRSVAYAYDYFRVRPGLTVIAGGSIDSLRWPANFRLPPLRATSRRDSRGDGKLGLVWRLRPDLVLRGALIESRGGITFDESVRLEPVQIAGFNQSFRTLLSEAYAGSVEAPIFRHAGVELAGSRGDRTWWSLSVGDAQQHVSRSIGAFDFLVASIFPFPGFAVLPGSTTEQLAYQEEEWKAGVNHLVGRELSLGLDYRHTRSTLARSFPEVPAAAAMDTRDAATLDSLAARAVWNSPTGWFGRLDATWTSQRAASSLVSLGNSSDSFVLVDLVLGRRFLHHRLELAGGVLNAGDTAYRLNPLNYAPQAPRGRTPFVRCRLSF